MIRELLEGDEIGWEAPRPPALRRFGRPTVPLAGSSLVEREGRVELLCHLGQSLWYWDLQEGRPGRILRLDAYTWSMAGSRDGGVVAALVHSGAEHRDRRLVVFDVPGGKLRPVEVPPGELRVVAVSPDGSRVAVGGTLGRVGIHDCASGDQLGEVRVQGLTGQPEASLVRLRFSPGGRYLLTRSRKPVNTKLHLEYWDLENGERVGGQWVPPEMRAVCLLPRGFLGERPHQTGNDWRLRRFPEEPGRETGSSLWIARGELAAYSEILDRALLLEGGRLRSFARGAPRDSPSTDLSAPHWPHFGWGADELRPRSDGTRLYVRQRQGIQNVDLRSGQRLRPRQPSSSASTPLGLDEEAGLVRVIAANWSLSGYREDDFESVVSHRTEIYWNAQGALNSTGRRVATFERGEGVSYSALAFLDWEDSTRDLRVDLPPNDGGRCLRFSPDDRLLAFELQPPGESVPAVHVVETEAGETARILPVERRIEIHRFSPDASTLALMPLGGSRLTLHPLDSEYEIDPIRTEGWLVRDLLFTPEGRFLLLACEDWTVRALDLRTRQVVHELKSPGGGVSALALSADGEQLYLACRDGCIYELPGREWIESVLLGEG